MNFTPIKYDYIVNQYQGSTNIEILDGCNSITFTNLGSQTVYVDGMPLYPGTAGSVLGDSRTIGGNNYEILGRKRVTISFSTDTPTVPSPTYLIEVIQKIYL